jgi:hypothetical protein
MLVNQPNCAQIGRKGLGLEKRICCFWLGLKPGESVATVGQCTGNSYELYCIYTFNV